ncbi:hypothetical protein PQX77_012375 [Marasmius sp. AFHP31]|nr:hypothetical protein PQX77_012375 [Marasmius sp. AFHP31]
MRTDSPQNHRGRRIEVEPAWSPIRPFHGIQPGHLVPEKTEEHHLSFNRPPATKWRAFRPIRAFEWITPAKFALTSGLNATHEREEFLSHGFWDTSPPTGRLGKRRQGQCELGGRRDEKDWILWTVDECDCGLNVVRVS